MTSIGRSFVTAVRMHPLRWQAGPSYAKRAPRKAAALACPDVGSTRSGAFARSCGLPFEAAGGVTIALVSSRERKRRQPGLATDGPELIRRLQLVRGIEASQVHPDLVRGKSEYGRAAMRTERAPGIV